MKLPSEPSSASHPNTEVPVATRANTPAHLLESGTSRISAKRLQNLLGEVWDEVVTDDCVDLAAQMSYYFALSLFPFLIVLAATVGWLPSTSLWHNLAQWITDYLPTDSRRMVFTTILNLTQSSPGIFSLGLVATIWTASSGFVSLMESLSVAYGVKETRGFWKKRLLAIMTTIVGAVFLLGSFGLLTFGRWAAILISTRLVTDFQVPWELGRWIASLLLMLIGLDLVNYFLPNVKRRWHWLTPGTAFVVLTMVIGSAIFNFYLRHFGDYPRFYGTMAGFIILMFWIYLASLILLIGAETDSVIERTRQRQTGASRAWSGSQHRP
jgi:membrane protein